VVLQALACDRVHVLRWLAGRGSVSTNELRREFPDLDELKYAPVLRGLEEQGWLRVGRQRRPLRFELDTAAAERVRGLLLAVLPDAVPALAFDQARLLAEVKLLRSPTRLKVLGLLRAEPDLTRGEVAARLGCHYRTSAYHSEGLQRSGWLVDGRVAVRPASQLLLVAHQLLGSGRAS
jgi:hypothetical protein